MKRRNTSTKEAVLQVLTHAGKAMSQDAIEQEITIDINRATIYRVLNRFCEDGILHKVIAEDGKQYFALGGTRKKTESLHQHFHFKCRLCNTIECLPDKVDFLVPKGYLIENVNCVITGVCKNCG